MPDRIVKAAVIRSKKVNSLSWQAECLYRRLINVVDDFGLYYADPMVLRADLFPMKLDKVKNSDITKWLGEVRAIGLIAIYEVEGEWYLKLFNTDKPRARNSKYPLPPANICEQMIADANKCPVVVDVVVDVVVAEWEERFNKFYEHFPKKKEKGKARKIFQSLTSVNQTKAIEQAEAYAEAYALAPDFRKQYFKGPCPWLNQECWDDDHAEWRLLIEGK